MTYNSKKVRKAEMEKQYRRASGNGGKADVKSTGAAGPAKTGKKNTKKNTWFAKLAGKVAPTAAAKEKLNEALAE